MTDTQKEILNETLILNEGTSLRFKFGIFKMLVSNAFIKRGDFEKARPKLMKLVNTAKNEDDIKYLKNDLVLSKQTLKNYANINPDIRSQINKHLKWVSTEYAKAITNKLRQLRKQNK